MIAHRHLDEGRDVKQLFLRLPDAGIADLAGLYRKDVTVDIAEGVADLIDDQGKRPVSAIAEIGRQRVEGVAEQPRIAQQQHPSAAEVDAAIRRAVLRVQAQVRPVAFAVIGLVKTVERRPVDAEQPALPVRGVEPVEVDQEAHDAVAEAMADWLEPRMHHLAEIKRGRGFDGMANGLGFGGWSGHGYSAACASSGGGARHGTDAPSACATSSPDRKPSSWKPYPVQAPQNQV